MPPLALISVIFFTVLLPALLGGVGFLLAARRSWLLPLLVAAGYIGGIVGLFGWPELPPAELRDWLPFVALALGISSSLGAWFARKPAKILPHGFAPLTLFVTAMLFGHTLFAPLIEYSWQPWETPFWLFGFAALPVLLRQLFCHLETRNQDLRWPIFLVVWGTAISLAIVFAGSATLGQMQGVLVATIGSSLLFISWKPTWARRLRFAQTFFVLMSYLHLAGAYFFAEMPAATALLLLGTPLCLYAGRSEGSRFGRLHGLVLALLPIAAALSVAWANYG